MVYYHVYFTKCIQEANNHAPAIDIVLKYCHTSAADIFLQLAFLAVCNHTEYIF